MSRSIIPSDPVSDPILVTGAAPGQVGSVGFKIVEQLRQAGAPVRAMVRHLDGRVEALTRLGAEVVAGDLTDIKDVGRCFEGCRSIYFGMALSPAYLEATVNAAAVAKHQEVRLFLNISQMTVSQMSVTKTTSSPQQKLHWLSEQVLNWSGLPVVHVRPTVFLDNPFFYQLAAQSIRNTGALELPFGRGKSSPIATDDVARVMATILRDPETHVGRVYELTGRKSQDMTAVAEEYSRALGRSIAYRPLAMEDWSERYLKNLNLPEHVMHHLSTMAELHRDNRYDRWTQDVERITGKEAMTVEAWVRSRERFFEPSF